MAVSLKFESVSKRYLLGASQVSFRDLLASSVNHFMRSAEINRRQEIWALKDVSFEVNEGEVIGIIGSNGAGKTTTLKLFSKVTRPTSGKIYTNGRLSSLIELGAGFHPDLTGRENVFLNGAIMGMKRNEIIRRFDEIVAFAEMEPFIDMPVKRYSSGMYARLGFSVAAHIDPDILLVDEVLAVGDEAFQIKCRDFLRSFIKNGHTSIFVSHNLYAIEQLCNRVVWLDKGQIREMGLPSPVLRKYMDEVDRKIVDSAVSAEQPASGSIKITDVNITNGNGSANSAIETDQDLRIAFNYHTEQRIKRPYLCIWISEAQSGVPLFSANMLLDNFDLPYFEGSGRFACHFWNVPLMPKAYNVWLEIYGEDRAELLYKWRVIGSFRVVDTHPIDEPQENLRGQVRFSRAHGAIKVPYKWHPSD